MATACKVYNTRYCLIFAARFKVLRMIWDGFLFLLLFIGSKENICCHLIKFLTLSWY